MRQSVIMAALFGLLLTSCGTIPRDPAGTSERVVETGVIRLGTVAGVEADPDIERALASLSASTGARVMRKTGPAEALLESLEKGEIDLVYGRLADDSPWASRVHLSKPPDGGETHPKSQRVPRFAMRVGENDWIMTVERLVNR